MIIFNKMLLFKLNKHQRFFKNKSFILPIQNNFNPLVYICIYPIKKFPLFPNNSIFIYIYRFVIMDEFLKNFSLANDIIRINQQEYFHAHFTTEQLDETIKSINNYEQYVYYFEPFHLFLFNLYEVKGRSVYIILKWVIITHKIIRLVRYPNLLTNIYETLNQIEIDHITDHYQQYLLEKLIKPYINFLQKLCLLLQKELLINQVKKNQVHFLQQTCFLKYNLIKFGFSQLSSTFKVFSSFLKEQYPFLSQFHTLIQDDLQRLFKQLKNDFKKDEVKLISQQDMNELSQQFFPQLNNPLRSQAFIITDITARKQQFAQLFESASKDTKLSIVLFPCF